MTTPFVLLAMFVLLAFLFWYCIRPERMGWAIILMILLIWCLLELGLRTAGFLTHVLGRTV